MSTTAGEWSRDRCRKEDEMDPLREFRDRFYFDGRERIYLDGNSLGRLPKDTPKHLERFLREEWGGGLVQSWNEWTSLPKEIGDRLGRDFLGAALERFLFLTRHR
jgi:kynureninase